MPQIPRVFFFFLWAVLVNSVHEQCPNSDLNTRLGHVHTTRTARAWSCRSALRGRQVPCRLAASAPGRVATPEAMSRHPSNSPLSRHQKVCHNTKFPNPCCDTKNQCRDTTSAHPATFVSQRQTVGRDTTKANHVTTLRSVSGHRFFPTKSRHQKVCRNTSLPCLGRVHTQPCRARCRAHNYRVATHPLGRAPGLRARPSHLGRDTTCCVTTEY